MTEFFRPYEGKRPFVFISYSHRNTARVLSLITPLHKGKLRLWYDEGIPAGRDWSGNIDAHMRACSAVLFFRSEPALASPNCLSEIQAAVERKRPLLIVPLDDAPVSEEWNALLSVGTTLELPADADADEILSGIRGWKVLTRAFFRHWWDSLHADRIGLAAALLLLLLTLGGLYGVLTGLIDPFRKEAAPVPTPAPTPTASPVPTEAPTPEPTADVTGYEELIPVNFYGSQKLETAVRAAIGKPESDGAVYKSELNGVTELLLCGHMYRIDPDDVRYEADGKVLVGTGSVIAGDVKNLTPIGDMPYLKRLALIRQPLGSLAPLNGLVALEELWLSGNEIDSVDALSDLPQLSVLHLEHTAVRDLSALSALPALKTVTVSIDMLPMIFPEDAPYVVRIVR